MDGVAHLLQIQDGVVSRRQLLEAGLRDHDVRRLLRRRELTIVHPGVYVEHTGPLTWQQRAWAAVLVHWPAALARESALPKPPAAAPIQVAIDLRRTVGEIPGVRAWRTPDLAGRVRWGRCPPRIAVEHALIDVASSAADDLAAYATMADVCQSRETSPRRVAAVLATRQRVPRGRWLRDVVEDLASGACSVLEHGYLVRVERAHGLPPGDRQVLATGNGRRSFRDVEYGAFGLVVELDGRPFHDTALSRDRDFERDLVTAVRNEARTVRLTYGQVFRGACATAYALGTLLQRGGWSGTPARCPQCPGS
jgi:hypothetical protein